MANKPFASIVTEQDLATVIDDQGTGTVYIAKAPKGSSQSAAVWFPIKRIVSSGGRDIVTYATTPGACNSTAVLAALTYA